MHAKEVARKPSREGQRMNMNRFGAMGLAAGLAVMGVTGCATKNYVRTQTAPLVEHTNQLDARTAANNRQIHEVDERAQAGINQAQGAADAAILNAQNASHAAGDAQTAANTRCIARTRWTAW